MAWLHHMAGNVEKSERYRHSRTWIRRNLDPVLAVVGGETAAPAAPVDARIALVAPFAALGLALLLWVVSLPQMDPSAMTDLGLISVMPTTFIIALGLLVGSFVTLVHRQPERRVALTAHLVTLIAFLHATPSILYGTLRYSWAWKHVGIVDYIQRHGTVTPSIHWLPVYHNWPGFFGLDALLTELAGLHSTLDMAIWGPPFFNLLDLGALLFLFTALTRDRRVIWLGCFFFLIANWVGQDYFSPQAFAFFLYLVTLGVIARWVGRRNRLRTPAVGLVVLLLVAIASAHALTSVMAVIAVGAAVVVRRSGVRWLPLAAGAITVVWDRVFAWDYVHANASGTFAQIRLPWSTTESSLTAVGKLSADQAFVAHVARGLVVGMVALAAVGAARQWQAGRLDRFAAALAAAPVLLFASGNYDGEILFRIYLFSVPFLAFLAASLFAAHGRSWAPALTGGVAALVLTAFVVAYYGKEHSNYFTPAEVSATNYLYTHAPAGSLLIEGTHNYPAQWKNYERFSYVTIANEPAGNVRRLLADPAGVLASWMAPHRSSFVILTRSQEIDVDANGAMPRGSVDRIQSALAASPRFRVVRRNADATIFALRRGGAR
jgi:hypothetical protein